MSVSVFYSCFAGMIWVWTFQGTIVGLKQEGFLRMNVTLIIILLCIIMSGYFSATETAFSSLNRIRIKNMADKGNKRAALVLKLSEDYDRLLSTILIGNNIVNIACASLSTLLFVRLLGEDAGASVSTAVTTVIVLVFGEVSPKSIAKESCLLYTSYWSVLRNEALWLVYWIYLPSLQGTDSGIPYLQDIVLRVLSIPLLQRGHFPLYKYP